MAHVEKSIFINAPIEKIFGFIAEPNNLPIWDYMAVKIKERSEGPVAIGTTFTLLVKTFNGIKMTSFSKLIKYDRPYSLLWETKSRGMLLHFGHRLETKDNGTLVTLSYDSAVAGKFLGRVIDKLFIGKSLARCVKRNVEDLKRVMESEQASGA
ncbi:MAG: SRPBCC family protein [Dehalococcoidia bacterium]|nr:SRPBCC family protein [Dehalococcoidia bacterium]